MTLHYLDTNCKDGFLEKLRGYLSSKILGNVQPLTDEGLEAFSASPEVSKDSLEASKDKLTSEQNPPKDNFIKLLDRAGRIHLHDFNRGNICIIGDDPEAINSFSDQLLSRLNDIPSSHEDIRSESISLRQLQGIADTRFLIKVSGLVRPTLLDSLIKSSGVICILPLAASKIISPLEGTVSSSQFSKTIAKALGGNQELRELLIGSLSKGEFLLVENTYYYPSGGKESVRRFITESEQSEEKLPK